MPAIITHHIFGEDASVLLPDDLLGASSEDLLAFLLGNLGVDPLRSRFTCSPSTARTCKFMAKRFYADHVCDALFVLRDTVSHLPESDKTIGRSFALGILAHYLLSSLCRPLIHALENALVECDPTLADYRPEICDIIEAEIDSWILFQKKQQTVVNAPSTLALTTTPSINRVAGSMLSQVAWQVFGIELPATEYARSVSDVRMIYGLIDPPATKFTKLLAKADKARGSYTSVRAMAHPIIEDDDCRLANLEHHFWCDPVTHERSCASFADLYHDALIAWPSLAKAYMEGDRDRLEIMIAGINYDGVPIEVYPF